MLKTNEDIDLQSRDVVEQCFARFGGITFKLGTFSNSNVLVPPCSVNGILLTVLCQDLKIPWKGLLFK